MATSSPRRSSQNGNGEASIEGQQANSLAHRCACPDDSKRRRLSSTSSNLNLASDAFQVARNFPRLSVYDLLNHSPVSPQTENPGENTNQGSVSPVCNESAEGSRIPRCPASFSNTSFSTLRPAFSIPE